MACSRQFGVQWLSAGYFTPFSLLPSRNMAQDSLESGPSVPGVADAAEPIQAQAQNAHNLAAF